jgi:hypothetical protein
VTGIDIHTSCDEVTSAKAAARIRLCIEPRLTEYLYPFGFGNDPGRYPCPHCQRLNGRPAHTLIRVRGHHVTTPCIFFIRSLHFIFEVKVTGFQLRADLVSPNCKDDSPNSKSFIPKLKRLSTSQKELIRALSIYIFKFL